MSPRPWPPVQTEPVRPLRLTTIIDDWHDEQPGMTLCPCGPGQGCERHGTHPRRDVAHTTRGGRGVVGRLRG